MPYSGKIFIISSTVTLLLGITGMILLETGFASYGFTLFCVIPFLMGAASGWLPRKKFAALGSFTGLAVFLTALLAAGLEGMACIIMSLMLIGGLVFTGWIAVKIIKFLIKGVKDRQKRLEDEDKTNLLSMLVPFALLFASNGIEQAIPQTNDLLWVRNEMVIKVSPEEAFEAIASVDTLAHPRNFWMNLGLPVPQKCVLQADTVGAKRTCIFEEGVIEEELVEIAKPRTLNMIVTAYKLPGRKWLRFQDAQYEFVQVENGTKVIRSTSYYSELRPAGYWKWFERKAIESEHMYVLGDLKARVE